MSWSIDLPLPKCEVGRSNPSSPLRKNKPCNALAEYSVHHLRVKARSGEGRYETVAGNHRALGMFMDRVGADRPLESITTEDIVEYDAYLSTLPGLYGRTLSGQSRRHHLNDISNLYRRAQSEGYVPPG